MFGALLGFMKNMMWVGFTLIEAFVFRLAYNYAAPTLIENFNLKFTLDNIDYWFTVSVFLLVGFLGGWIKKLTPKFISVKNDNENKNK